MKDQDETPKIGSICKDGGTCHHRCSELEGCFRQQCCVPLSCSGLDDKWRTPQEAALDEAVELNVAAATAGAQPGRPGL